MSAFRLFEPGSTICSGNENIDFLPPEETRSVPSFDYDRTMDELGRITKHLEDIGSMPVASPAQKHRQR